MSPTDDQDAQSANWQIAVGIVGPHLATVRKIAAALNAKDAALTAALARPAAMSAKDCKTCHGLRYVKPGTGTREFDPCPECTARPAQAEDWWEGGELERLRDFIWSLDGKTICIQGKNNTFIDDGIVVASDIVGTPPAAARPAEGDEAKETWAHIERMLVEECGLRTDEGLEAQRPNLINAVANARTPADPGLIAAAVKFLRSGEVLYKIRVNGTMMDREQVASALSTSRPAQAEDGWKPVDLYNALRRLTDAEMKYRHAHDLHGDGSLDSGRAWDKMRQAGDHARDLLRVVEPKLVDIKQPEG